MLLGLLNRPKGLFPFRDSFFERVSLTSFGRTGEKSKLEKKAQENCDFSVQNS